MHLPLKLTLELLFQPILIYFLYPFCTPQTNSLKIGKIQWQMPILPMQQHVARVSYTYTMYRPSQSYSY